MLLTITNRTASSVVVGGRVGTLAAASVTTHELTTAELEAIRSRLVSLDTASVILWAVSPSTDTSDDAAEGATVGYVDSQLAATASSGVTTLTHSGNATVTDAPLAIWTRVGNTVTLTVNFFADTDGIDTAQELLITLPTTTGSSPDVVAEWDTLLDDPALAGLYAVHGSGATTGTGGQTAVYAVHSSTGATTVVSVNWTPSALIGGDDVNLTLQYTVAAD
jgi:hypothetical protein